MRLRQRFGSVTTGNVLFLFAVLLAAPFIIPGSDLEVSLAKQYSPEAGRFFGATFLGLAGAMALASGMLDRKTDSTGQWKSAIFLGCALCAVSMERFIG